MTSNTVGHLARSGGRFTARGERGDPADNETKYPSPA